MNTALLKAKMEMFFANVNPSDLVEQFKKMGYVFIDSDLSWESVKSYNIINEGCSEKIERKRFQRIFHKKAKIKSKKLTSDYPGSFFCLRIAG